MNKNAAKKTERFHYPKQQARVDAAVWKELDTKRKQDNLTWNQLLKKVLDKYDSLK